VDKVVHGVGFKSKWGTEDMEKRNNSKQSQWKWNIANDCKMEMTEDKGKMGSQINCNRCGLRHRYREAQRIEKIVEIVVVLITLQKCAKRKNKLMRKIK